MGIIRAITGAIGGGLADSWLEVLEPGPMSDTTVLVSGVKVRQNDKRNQNEKGTDNTVSDGSVIHVYPNQFMMLIDGGKVVDYTAEEGYYTVSNSSMPSLFNGQFGNTLKETFNRIRFGGTPSLKQKVYFINLQEIKGIKFGTRNPINYFDNFYNAELFLRTHGTYSIKVTDPLKFFAEAIPRDRDRVDFNDINEQYLSEFLSALQSAMNQMSVDGVRISHVGAKSRELGQYMGTILDEEWNQMRGMQIQAVGVASISYDEESQKLINMRNQGAMLGDPSVREGYVQGAAARGMEAAGSNPNGAMGGFVGLGMANMAGGNIVGAASATNAQQMAQQQANGGGQAASGWACAKCGQGGNQGKFCSQCGEGKPKAGWTCEKCGHEENIGKFCIECGAAKPDNTVVCDKCGHRPDPEKPTPKFCPECGDAIDENDRPGAAKPEEKKDDGEAEKSGE